MLSPTWYSFPSGRICLRPSASRRLFSGSKPIVIFLRLIIGIAFTVKASRILASENEGVVALLAARVRVDGDDLVPAAALEEIVPLHVALDTDPDRSGVAVKRTLGWPARASLRERAILLPLL